MSFALPPVLKNQQGKIRTVGFEIEFGELPANRAAELVAEVLGGRRVETDCNEFAVRDTPFGSFSVKLDTRLGRDSEPDAGALEVVGAELSKLTLEAIRDLVPIEIVTPPMPVDQIEALETLIERLRADGARGTEESLLYAFALHINPEAPELTGKGIVAVMKAYMLLSPTLWRDIHPDMTRRVLGFAEPFDDSYVAKVLDQDYWPDIPCLIDDYLDANPTRDRDLDLLPLFAHLDEERVRARLPNEKIGRRPTFHYRLPDARISDPSWSLAQEWNRWVSVERLAADASRLQEMCGLYWRAGQDRKSLSAELREIVGQ